MSLGYRSTSPAQVYIAHSAEELWGIEEGYGYTDPLGLKDTLLSFEYSLGPKKGAGGVAPLVTKLRLINPGVKLEEKLFALHTTFNLRAKTPTGEPIDATALAQNIKEGSTFFMRFGYQSPAEGEGANRPIESALSKVHELFLWKMDFVFNQGKERQFTLYFMDTRSATVSSPSFLHHEKTFRVGCDDNATWKPPSVILSDLLGQMATPVEGYPALVNFSEEQASTIDNAMLDYINKATMLKESSAEGHKVKSKELAHKKRFAAIDNITTYTLANSLFFTALGIGFTTGNWYEQTGVSEPKNPEKKANMAQTTGRNQGTVDKPAVIDADVQAESTTAGSTPGIPPQRYEIEIPLYDMNAAGGITFGIIPPNTCYYALPDKESGGYRTDLMLEDLEWILKNDKYVAVYKNQFFPLPLTPQTQYLKPGEWWPLHFLVTSMPISAEADEDRWYPITLDRGGLESYVKNLRAVALGNMNAQQLEGFGDNRERVEEFRTAYADVVGDDDPYMPLNTKGEDYCHSVYLNISPGEYKNAMEKLVGTINKVLLKENDRYLQFRILEYANVPPVSRGLVEAALGDASKVVDWENDKGLVMVTPQPDIDNIFSQFNSAPFASFSGVNIINEGGGFSDDTISLATGYDIRPDNIITNLQFSQPTSPLLGILRSAPTVGQKMYNVAKRMDDSEYREKVMETVVLVMDEDDSGDEKKYMELKGAGGKSEFKNAVGGVVFSENAVKKAFGQASKYAGAPGDSAEQGDVKKQISEDLQFLSNPVLFNAVFPRVKGNDRSVVRQKWFADGEVKEAETAQYRYMVSTPIGSLQGDADTDEGAELQTYLAKMAMLTAFKKTITNVSISTLGIPEMDVFADEVGRRSVMLDVHEPRMPGTQHWLSGIYTVAGVSHKIDQNGFQTNINLIPSLVNTEENYSRLTIMKHK